MYRLGGIRGKFRKLLKLKQNTGQILRGIWGRYGVWIMSKTYCVYKIEENGPLKYGIYDDAAFNMWISQGFPVQVLETFPTLRMASAALKMRNDVIRSIDTMLREALRRGLEDANVIAAVSSLRHADAAPIDEDAMRRRAAVRLLLDDYVKKDHQTMSELRSAAAIARAKEDNKKRYPYAIDNMTEEEKEKSRALARSLGFIPRY